MWACCALGLPVAGRSHLLLLGCSDSSFIWEALAELQLTLLCPGLEAGYSGEPAQPGPCPQRPPCPLLPSPKPVGEVALGTGYGQVES